MILYADDTNVFFSGDNLTDLIQQINGDFEKILLWLRANNLSLNIKKTHCMNFSNRTFTYNNDIKIDNEIVENVESTKFLGVILDNKLCWKKHILYVRGKIARSVGTICKSRQIFNQDTLKDLYYSFVYPHLCYCIEIWGSAHKTHIDRLFKLQKKCVRIICKAKWNSPSSPLFSELELLTLILIE